MASSARLKSQQAQEVPWRKALALGAVLGSTVQRKSVAALAEKRSKEVRADPADDPFASAELSLVAFLRDHRLKDEQVVTKLMDDLRRRNDVDPTLAETIDAGFRGRLGTPPHVQGERHPAGSEPRIQQVIVPHNEGTRVLVIARYFDHLDDLKHIQAMQSMLRHMRLTTFLEEGLFLRCIAQSHTAEELSQERGAEIMVMLEPFSGTLDQFLRANPINYFHRLILFVDALADVERLFELGIPHMSRIGFNSVLVMGDAAERDSMRVVLSPLLITNDWKESPLDTFNEDLRQLGSLLRRMYNSTTWVPSERPAVDVLLAFGKAMESGAMAGGLEALWKDLSRLTTMLFSDGITEGELKALRFEYLTRAVEAETWTEP